MKIRDILLAKPIDLKVYREENYGGLTLLLYELPWSVIVVLLLIIYWSCR